ncbi:hypothetical protein M0804_004113 [Polistes exclamans]|nr:hypothetical protein M0804_004113 [Polistes exclamans]
MRSQKQQSCFAFGEQAGSLESFSTFGKGYQRRRRHVYRITRTVCADIEARGTASATSFGFAFHQEYKYPRGIGKVERWPDTVNDDDDDDDNDDDDESSLTDVDWTEMTLEEVVKSRSISHNDDTRSVG